MKVTSLIDGIKLLDYSMTCYAKQISSTNEDTIYCLWKASDVWMLSLGDSEYQSVFLVTQSQIAAEIVYKHALEYGLKHIKG